MALPSNTFSRWKRFPKRFFATLNPEQSIWGELCSPGKATMDHIRGRRHPGQISHYICQQNRVVVSQTVLQMSQKEFWTKKSFSCMFCNYFTPTLSSINSKVHLREERREDETRTLIFRSIRPVAKHISAKPSMRFASQSQARSFPEDTWARNPSLGIPLGFRSGFPRKCQPGAFPPSGCLRTPYLERVAASRTGHFRFPNCRHDPTSLL